MSPRPTTPAAPRRGAAFAVATAISVLTIVDTTKVNVGLPSIEHALGATSTELQLIVAGYTLAMGLVLVPAGRLGDLSSRRRMLAIGLVLFTAASLGGALAPSAGVLVLFRIVQGLAAGMMTPQVVGLIQELYSGPERGRAFGIFGASVGIATALGPTVGGVLIGLGGEPHGWGLLFWMNVPLGVILFVLALRVLPGPRERQGDPGGLDPVGVLLLGATVFPLMVPFVLTTGGPGDDPARWLWLLAAAGFGLAFVRWERHYRDRGRQPLIDVTLFATPSFRNGVLVGSAYFAAMPAFFLIMTLFLQQGLGLAPAFAGMVSIGFALASAVSSWWSGRHVNRLGRPIVLVGLALVGLGFGGAILAAQLAEPGATPWLVAGALAVAGLGGGAVIAPNQTLTLAEVPVRFAGVAGSVAQVGQRVGTAMGTAAVTAIFFLTLTTQGREDPASFAHAFLWAGVGVLVLVALAFAAAAFDERSRRRG